MESPLFVSVPIHECSVCVVSLLRLTCRYLRLGHVHRRLHARLLARARDAEEHRARPRPDTRGIRAQDPLISPAGRNIKPSIVSVRGITHSDVATLRSDNAASIYRYRVRRVPKNQEKFWTHVFPLRARFLYADGKLRLSVDDLYRCEQDPLFSLSERLRGSSRSIFIAYGWRGVRRAS